MDANKPAPKTLEQRKAEVDAETARLTGLANAGESYNSQTGRMQTALDAELVGKPAQEAKLAELAQPTPSQLQADALIAQETVAPEEMTGQVPQAAAPAASSTEPTIEFEPTQTEKLSRQSIANIDAATAATDRALMEQNKAIAGDVKNFQEREKVINEVKNRMQKLDEKLQELSAQEVNPDRYWQNKTGYQKALAGIGLAFGALGASQGGINRAAETINSAIKDDIEAQKANINSKFQTLKEQNNLYKDMLSVYKDPELAYSAATVIKLEQTKNTIGMYANRVKNEQAKGQAIALLANVEQQQAKIKADMADKVATDIQLGKDYTLDQLQNASPALTKDLIALPDGKVRRAFSPEAKKIYDEVAKDSLPAIQLSKDLRKLMLEGSKLNIEDRAKVRQNLVALVGKLRVPFTGPGILTDKEYDRLESVISNPNAFVALPSAEKAKLLNLENSLQNSINTAATLASGKGANFTSAEELRAQIAKQRNAKKLK